jgi:hypothetical protein
MGRAAACTTTLRPRGLAAAVRAVKARVLCMTAAIVSR